MGQFYILVVSRGQQTEFGGGGKCHSYFSLKGDGEPNCMLDESCCCFPNFEGLLLIF